MADTLILPQRSSEWARPRRVGTRLFGLSPTSALTIYAALLFLSSARLVVPGMGGFGTPANLAAMGLLMAWVTWRSLPRSELPMAPQPVRSVLLLFIGWWLVVYAMSNARSFAGLVTDGADRQLLSWAALLGVALVAMDTLDRAGVVTLLRRLVLLAGALGAMTITQFFVRVDVAGFLRLPGLVANQEIVMASGRSMFSRPFATALHPIELGVVLAMVTPLAVHFSLHGRGAQRPVTLERASLVCILFAIPMTVSRSGMLGLMVAMLVLLTGWSARRRLNALVVSAIFVAVMTVGVPGLLGTLRGMFLRASTDPSIQGRLNDVSDIKALISSSPWLGLGPGRFNPEDHFTLDNQYYGTAVVTGLPGLFTLLLLLAVLVVAAWRITRVAEGEQMQHLARALLASVLVAAVCMATFDAFSFRIFTGLLFMVAGAIGALWRCVAMNARRPPDGG